MKAIMRTVFAAIFIGGCLMRAAAAQAEQSDNSIYNDLVEKGIKVSNGETIVLPKPVMADGLSDDAQRKIIVAIVNPKILASFLKGGLSEQYERKLTAKPGKDPNDTKGKIIDLYFIANGKFETVADKNFMKEEFNGGNGKATFLTDDELKERKLSIVDNEKMRERLRPCPIRFAQQDTGRCHGSRNSDACQRQRTGGVCRRSAICGRSKIPQSLEDDHA